MDNHIQCGTCLFSHDHPFIGPLENFIQPVHCSIHFSTVEASDSCRDGREESEGRRIRRYKNEID